jgi:hypothetical protein
MGGSAQSTYERPTSYHKLNFPAQIFHDTVFYIYVCTYCFGVSLPCALFHHLFLLLDF